MYFIYIIAFCLSLLNLSAVATSLWEKDEAPMAKAGNILPGFKEMFGDIVLEYFPSAAEEDSHRPAQSEEEVLVGRYQEHRGRASRVSLPKTARESAQENRLTLIHYIEERMERGLQPTSTLTALFLDAVATDVRFSGVRKLTNKRIKVPSFT